MRGQAASIGAGLWHGRLSPWGQQQASLLSWLAQQQSLAQALDVSGNVIKSDRFSRVAIVSLADGRQFYIKEYRSKNLLQACSTRLGLGRARHSWRIAHQLQAAELAVARPYALLTESQGLGGCNSYYLCEVLLGFRDLKASALEAGVVEYMAEPSRQKMLSHAIAQLHQRGFVHGDMKWSNILVDNKGASCFIDLDGVSTGVRSLRRQGRDLARFVINGIDLGLCLRQLDPILAEYAALRGLAIEAVEQAMAPSMNKLARRHAGKYSAEDFKK